MKYQLIVKSLSGVKHSEIDDFDKFSSCVYKVVSRDGALGAKGLKRWAYGW